MQLLPTLLLPLLLTGDAASAAKDYRLPVIRKAPQFTLVDQDGKKVSFPDDYRGKIVLVSFIFTTCNGTCPATTHRLAFVEPKIAADPRLKDRVHFLSITLDPERDRPEILRGYRDLYELEKANWKFLTGDPKDVKAVHKQWQMWVKAAENGQLDHPSRIFLVDARGQIREIYNLSFLRLPWVLEDIRSLE